MPSTPPILNNLTNPPKMDNEKLDKFFNELKRWADDLIKVLKVYLTGTRQQISTSAALSGVISIPFINNIPDDTAQDFILPVDFSFNINITRVYCKFDEPSITPSPVWSIRNASGGAGSGIAVSLTGGYYGSNTGSVAISAGQPTYMRVQNCKYLGSGNIILEYE